MWIICTGFNADHDTAFKVKSLSEKNAIYLSLVGSWRTWKLQEKPSALTRTRSNNALSNKKLLHFFFSVSFLSYKISIRIPNADTDPADQNHCGSGSTTLPVSANFTLVNIIAACSKFRSEKSRQILAHLKHWTYQFQNQTKWNIDLN